MYLNKKTYVQNWEHQGEDKQHTISVKVGGKVRKDIKPERITYITEQIGYWRKFNALHGWFVENCGGGVDECQPIEVSIEDLDKLRDTLNQVITLINNSKKVTKVLQDWNGKDYEMSVYECEDEVKELLSPTEGFFFGNTEIDDYYKQDVEKTIELIDNIFKEEENSKELGLYSGDYFYQASW